MAADSKYVIKLWNEKYGNGARFIVERTADGKQTELIPGNLKDMAWADKLATAGEYKNWDSFKDEPVDDLALIEM